MTSHLHTFILYIKIKHYLQLLTAPWQCPFLSFSPLIFYKKFKYHLGNDAT